MEFKQFKSPDPALEVSGEAIGATLDGFKKYPSVALKYLAKLGFVKTENAKLGDIDRTIWYPMQNWLSVFEGIANEVGVNSLYSVGRTIPKNAVFPPHVTDIYSSIASLDVAYHMNHRKNGVSLFDPATGKMTEGIGHYGSEPVANEKKIICVVECPYPCDFDRGILATLGTRFEPNAFTVHDDTAPCRKKGGNTCTYVVSW